MDTISWLFNYVPWWVWPLIAAGGGGAILAFVPGALALVVSIWNMLPRSVKLILGGVIAAALAYFAGRNKGSKDERLQQERRGAQAVATRKEVDDEVRTMSPTKVDAELKRHGDFRED